ncbi:glutaminase A [Streptosporangium sp. 'caverna']|uniref:glutaminase A n=1 Tax=Streptosporangium sp. 'caverna' TaxID=2202249 RepID=UPI000D7D6B19|nr:glutaminase A [Streptosporangium sp. 'caverna']AWS44222.1 glutaminase A [Streptosporangium sp. 'caverna']
MEASNGRVAVVTDTAWRVRDFASEESGGYRKLFDSFKKDARGHISRIEMIARLQQAGITPDDPRMVDAFDSLEEADTGGQLDYARFAKLCQQSGGLPARAITGDLAIPDFSSFTADITGIYESLLPERRGEVANYIPQLKRVPPEQFAIVVCTVDGQRFSIGDSSVGFCVQSVCKPVNYSLTLEEHGAETVHRHVGREPSGRGFNELSLNGDGLPHNPMINSGAIMSCSLIKPDLDIADRFDYVAATWQRLSGGRPVGFNNAVYLSERQTADRNFALGYFMREHKAFPQDTDLVETLEFYFQCCSIELHADALASAAATLANGGVVPLSNDRVFSTGSVQKCLSLMSSCGMYDYSGEFAFTIGLPAKSGVSGALMVVIPKVMGIAIWSPRLDGHGNSVRGIEFCRQLVEKYNFHTYDSLVQSDREGKRDPRLKKNQAAVDGTIRLLWSASTGDLEGVRALLASGVSPRSADYDGRTALHLAAAEGHLDLVTYLLERGADHEARDRWGGIPLTDAERGGHAEVMEALKQWIDPVVASPSTERRTA